MTSTFFFYNLTMHIVSWISRWCVQSPTRLFPNCGRRRLRDVPGPSLGHLVAAETNRTTGHSWDVHGETDRYTHLRITNWRMEGERESEGDEEIKNQTGEEGLSRRTQTMTRVREWER